MLTFANNLTQYSMTEEIKDLHIQTDMASEPSLAMSAACINQNVERVFSYPHSYDPGLGPYSTEEMNKRIDSAEADLHNNEKWVQVDDFAESMKKEHLWLS